MPEWLRQRALISPHALALQAGAERSTFAELDALVEGTALRLREVGIRPGDRIALLARNSAGFVRLLHAAGRAGAALAPLNTRLTTPEIGWQLGDVRPALFVFDDANAVKAREAPSGRRIRALPLADLLSPPGPAREVPPVDLSALHTIIYTSGTTGQPKGAMLTYSNQMWSALGSALNMGLHEDDRWLVCLPLFHVGGLTTLVKSVLYGMPVVLHEGFDPAAVNRAIDDDGVTMTSVVATMLQRMLEERGDRPYPSHLRCVLVGGGPVPPDLLRRALERGLPVVQTYGLTEACSQVATLSPADAARKLGSAGKPLLPTELRIEREDGAGAAPGEAGEIVVRGPTVMPGYFGAAEASERALRGGWLHTGDAGYMDDGGYLYVLDRRDDLIISGGENVYPAEVEAALRAHPAVADAGVIGVADARWGQAVAAAVVPRAGQTLAEDDVLAFCRERLAPFKVPRVVRVVTELPRNAAGKLLRRELREGWGASE
ncbi:MAG: o-succinylbenzoate--CoA ligase [Dehalococcoidia bacterium]|nr:o-succinylbenzoate--CoA ligase [Dehalococcoidia bacterium]